MSALCQKRTLPGGGLRHDPPRPDSVAAGWSDPPQIVHVAFMSSKPLFFYGEGQHGVESWLERKRRPRRRLSRPKITGARLVLGRRRWTFRLRGVTDLAKRLNGVQPLLLWRNDLLLSQSVTPLAPRHERRRSRA